MSAYAYEYHLKNGYITIKGGHRIGICGKTVIKNNEIALIKDISSINIRISKNRKLFSHRLFKQLTVNNKLSNICVISPPGCGKTTFIKNFVSYLASTHPHMHLCVIDERGEICPSDMGTSTDCTFNSVSVMSDCPKNASAEVILRTMSPDMVVCDEIWSSSEAEAVNNILKSGIKCVFSLHGKNFDTCLNRPDIDALKPLLVVEMSDKNGKGTIENIRRFV